MRPFTSRSSANKKHTKIKAKKDRTPIGSYRFETAKTHRFTHDPYDPPTLPPLPAPPTEGTQRTSPIPIRSLSQLFRVFRWGATGREPLRQPQTQPSKSSRARASKPPPPPPITDPAHPSTRTPTASVPSDLPLEEREFQPVHRCKQTTTRCRQTSIFRWIPPPPLLLLEGPGEKNSRNARMPRKEKNI